MMPSTRPRATRNMVGPVIQAAVGVGFVVATPGLTLNAPHRNLALYATVKAEPTAITAVPIAPAAPPSSRPAYPDSLAANPSIGGIPAMLIAARVASTATIGMLRPSPESLVRSLVPVEVSIKPTTKNNGALNVAWAISIASPPSSASGLPQP